MSPLFATASLFAFVCGIVAAVSPRWSVRGILLLVAVMPTGYYLRDLNSFEGAYFFDGFTLGGVCALVARQLVGGDNLTNVGLVRWPNGVRSPLVLGATFLGIYFVYFALGLLDGVSKFYLQDLRPALNLGFIAVFMLVFGKAADLASPKTIVQFVLATCIASFLKYAVSLMGVHGSEDVFYEEGAYRYLDGGTYVAAVYLVGYLVRPALFDSNRKLAMVCAGFALATVVISNSRFMLVSLVVAILFVSRLSMRQRVAAFSGSVVAVGCVIALSRYFEVSRVLDAADPQAIVQQIALRFSPAVSVIRDMNWWQHLVGLGIGTTFNIPWFAYRGLDTESVTVDSAVLTYYSKFGVFGLVLIWLFVRTFVWTGSRYAAPLGCFAALMCIVSSYPYHPYVIGLGLAAVILSFVERRDVNHSLRGRA